MKTNIPWIYDSRDGKPHHAFRYTPSNEIIGCPWNGCLDRSISGRLQTDDEVSANLAKLAREAKKRGERILCAHVQNFATTIAVCA